MSASTIGQIILEDGEIKMTNLILVFAGGLSEAKRVLKLYINQYSKQSVLWCGLSIATAVIAAGFAHIIYSENYVHNEIIRKTHNRKENPMPIESAEECGTHCIICSTNPISQIFTPCGHLCLCFDCFETSHRRLGTMKCPICQ